MKQTFMRHWAMLRMLPSQPRKIDVGTLKDQLKAAGFDITLRSIQRDLNKLSRVLPLMADDAKPQGWSWHRDARQSEHIVSDPQSALTFHLASLHLQDLLPKETLSHLAPWFDKAKVILDQQENHLSDWPSKIRVVPRLLRLLPPRFDREVCAAIYDALLNDRQVQISYRARDGKLSKGMGVNPLALIARNDLLYLVCTVVGYGDVRQFLLHRIQSANVLNEESVRPADFDVDAYIASGVFGFLEDNEPIMLDARFAEEAAAHLQECHLSDSQSIEPENNGWVRVKAIVKNTSELRWWLMGFGEKVEVLSPTSLREKMRTSVQAMTRMYG